MKRSTPIAAPPEQQVLGIAVVLVDLLSRLAAPASVLVLAHGWPALAIGAGAAVSALAVARGLIGGALGEQVAVGLWQRLAQSVGEASILDLRARPPEQQAWRLVGAAHRVADLHAQIVPRLVADALALGCVAIAVAWRLGLGWLLAGIGTVAVLALLLVPGQRAVRRADARVWELLTDLGTDLDLLLEAPAEARAHGRDVGVCRDLLERAVVMAREHRRVHTYSALVGLFPVGVALLAVSAPQATGLLEGLGHDVSMVAEIGVLGGSGLVFGIGLVRGVEAWLRALPESAMIAHVVRGKQKAAPTSDSHKASWLSPIEFDGVTVRYPGSDAATPDAVNFAWAEQRGLALLGPNGAGKTTLALVLLGLVEPTQGTVKLGGVPLADCDRSRLRRATIYLPQSPFVAPERTVRWHLSLVHDEALSGEACLEGLRGVGLEERLQHHVSGGGGTVLDVLVGELSGGEQRRLHLARLFMPRDTPAELVIVDEPEAGLDERGRSMVHARLKELAQSARVLIIAHEGGVIPTGFDSLAVADRACPEAQSSR